VSLSCPPSTLLFSILPELTLVLSPDTIPSSTCVSSLPPPSSLFSPPLLKLISFAPASSPLQNFRAKEELDELIRDGGPFEDVAPLPPPSALVAYLEQLALENKKAQASISLVPDVKEMVVEDSMNIRTAGVRA